MVTGLVEQLRAQVIPAVRVALAAYGPDPPPSERVMDAWGVIFRTTAILRRMVPDPSPVTETLLDAEERRAALGLLLEVWEPLRAELPQAIEVFVRLAGSDPNELAEGMTREDWQRARDTLTSNGFLNPGELATFPVESLVQIAQERLRRWEETGNARG